MTNQPIDETKNFLKKGLLFVCGALVLYAICCIVVTTGSVIWAREDRKITNANATVTSAAHTAEQDQYDFVDRFEDTSGHWHVGIPPNRNWEGTLQIKDGVYTWDVDKVKAPFFHQVDFFHEIPIKDFDTYLDTKFSEETPGSVCGGLVFRKSFQGWNHGSYIFMICNDSTFNIAYFGEVGWEVISGRRINKAILPVDWNRLEIEARGNHFVFQVNHTLVYELTDDRQVEGALGIAIEVHQKDTTVIWFDNFGYQPR